MKREAIETVGHANGIPDKWLRSLVDANNRFPVGDPAIVQMIAPTLFRSLITREISFKDLMNSELSDEQLHGLKAAGDKKHDDFGVDKRVKTDQLERRWENDKDYFAELVAGVLDWLNTEKFGMKRNPQSLVVLEGGDYYKMFSFELDETLKDPVQKEKLGLVLSVLDKAVESTNSPESLRSAERHKMLLITDPEYRKVQCANVALNPMYANMQTAVMDEAGIIEQKKGIEIPLAVMDWFRVDWIEPGLHKFL